MLKWWMRLAWFLSSYSPLWIILTIFNYPTITGYDKQTQAPIYDGSWLLVFLFAAIAILSNAVIFGYLASYRKRDNGSEEVELKNPVVISELSKEYIVTYAISLIGFNLVDLRQAVSFAFLVFFFAFLYVKYNDITYNPMLDFFGYRIYDASFVRIQFPKYSNGEYVETSSHKVISKKRKQDFDAPIFISNIGDDVFVEIIKHS